jgi:type IV pilus assembly protein PilB
VFNQFGLVHVVVPIVDLIISNADLTSLLKFIFLANTPIGVLKQYITLIFVTPTRPALAKDLKHFINFSENDMVIPPESAVSTIDALLHEALALEASDVHFESGDNFFRIRFRIDGLLRVMPSPPFQLRDAIISRLKVLARMDIAEKRIPQDGRIQYVYQDQRIDLRVSSLPTLHGEKLVVRILNSNKHQPDMATLGYEPDDRHTLHQAILRPHGLILMTGPTGCGKTLSLYSCLALLNRTETNICTVEDPSEIHLSGVNQVNINDRAGLSFAATLRAFLRQDPDVIMVGEIRDLETAEVAIQAAQTGHLVLSTLHTNDAPSTLARLRHMGIAAFNVAASVHLITAQRLVRRLCARCKQPLRTEQIREFFNSLAAHDQHALLPQTKPNQTLFHAVGCDACNQGYKGRIGIYQVMPISDAMQHLIIHDSDAQTLATQAAQEGIRTLRQAGWLKVLQGITSIEEILAFTPHA